MGRKILFDIGGNSSRHPASFTTIGPPIATIRPMEKVAIFFVFL
jgi:hypothetical protein